MTAIHLLIWRDHRIVVPCGISGVRTLSTDRSLVDCEECLQLDPDRDPTPWCTACGPRHACTCGPIADND
jgi:hypothetical protein